MGAAMTKGEVSKYMAGVLAPVFDALQQRFLRIESRVAQIEARETQIAKALQSLPTYRGVYEPGQTYARGTFITLHGSMWHANQATTSKPGGGPDWTLAVKRGSDAK